MGGVTVADVAMLLITDYYISWSLCKWWCVLCVSNDNKHNLLVVSIFLPIAYNNRAHLTFTPEYILTPSPCLLWAHTQKVGHCWLRGNIGRLKNRISNHFIKGLMWSSHASYISYSTTGTSQHNIVTPPRALQLQDEGDYRNESHHYRLLPSLPPINTPPTPFNL